jgi:hypothetical protein
MSGAFGRCSGVDARHVPVEGIFGKPQERSFEATALWSSQAQELEWNANLVKRNRFRDKRDGKSLLPSPMTSDLVVMASTSLIARRAP